MSGGAFGASPGAGLADPFELGRRHGPTERLGVAQDRAHVDTRVVITGSRRLWRKRHGADGSPQVAGERVVPVQLLDGDSIRSTNALGMLMQEKNVQNNVHNLLELAMFGDKVLKLPLPGEFDEFSGFFDIVGRTGPNTNRTSQIPPESDEYETVFSGSGANTPNTPAHTQFAGCLTVNAR